MAAVIDLGLLDNNQNAQAASCDFASKHKLRTSTHEQNLVSWESNEGQNAARDVSVHACKTFYNNHESPVSSDRAPS